MIYEEAEREREREEVYSLGNGTSINLVGTG